MQQSPSAPFLPTLIKALLKGRLIAGFAAAQEPLRPGRKPHRDIAAPHLVMHHLEQPRPLGGAADGRILARTSDVDEPAEFVATARAALDTSEAR